MAKPGNKLLIFGLILFTLGTSAKSETLFVQAIGAPLRALPKQSAAQKGKLKRGDAVLVQKTEGKWVLVKAGTQEGWACRLFFSELRPVGHAELAQEAGLSLEKASRRRSSSYSVSAATRGLMASTRVRTGHEENPNDFLALKAMEEYALPEGSLKAFATSARLSID